LASHAHTVRSLTPTPPAAARIAESYPASQVTGFDNHGPSIQEAAKRAAEAGLSDRVSFEVEPLIVEARAAA
jgi:hypothetical protein